MIGKMKFAAGILCAAAMFSMPTGASLAANGKLVAAISADVATLDPTIYHAVVSFHARLNIFDALIDISPEATVVPRLATKWESSSDAKQWTFTIRTDAQFHNGEPVTIDDVIYSFQKILDDNKSPTRSYISNIASIDRVSDNQVRFNLSAPFAPFDRNIAVIMIIPKKAYQEMGAVAFGQKPVGSGPYKVVQWIKDDRISLEAFDKWWGGAPSIKQVELRPVPNEATRASALLSGEVDVVPALPPALMDTLKGRAGVKVEVADSYKVVYMGFNPATPQLADVRMRQAIDMAIDRKAITDSLLRGMGVPVGQIVAPMSVGFDKDRPATAYNPEKARELVKAAGYDGTPIMLEFPSDFIASAPAIASAIAGYLEAVGINAKLSGSEYNSFYAKWSAKQLQAMHLFVFGPMLLDADVPINLIYNTKGNRGYIGDPKVDELAVKARAEADPEKRKQLIAEIWNASDAFQPFSFLYNERQAVGMRDNVEWKPQADGIIRLWQVKMN